MIPFDGTYSGVAPPADLTKTVSCSAISLLDPEVAVAFASGSDRLRHSIRPADVQRFRAGVREAVVSPAGIVARWQVTARECVAQEPAGKAEVPLLILAPAAGAGPWPCVYHIHGGGMIAGDKSLRADELARWVQELGIVAVSVGYRLAPEHPHPAPVEDCYAGLRWISEHHDELRVDPRALIIHGVSAGGGLAAATALLARDRGGPFVTHQILLSPMLDERNITPSSYDLIGEGVWDRTSNATGWSALLGDRRDGGPVSEYAAPARAADLRRLPSTYIEVGQVEIFRDEVIEYAARLARARVPTELHVWPGACHGFDRIAPDAGITRRATATRADFLRRAIDAIGARSHTLNGTCPAAQ